MTMTDLLEARSLGRTYQLIQGFPQQSDLSETAERLMEQCPGFRRRGSLAKVCCRRMEAGIEGFTSAYQKMTPEKSTVSADALLHALLLGMDEPQRKGFLLHCLTSLRGAEKFGRTFPKSAALASLAEPELFALVSDCLERETRNLALALIPRETADSLPAETEPFPLSVAAYAGAVNGALPEMFQQFPEAVGACSAAQEAIRREMRGNREGRWLATFLSGVAGILLGCVLLWASFRHAPWPDGLRNAIADGMRNGMLALLGSGETVLILSEIMSLFLHAARVMIPPEPVITSAVSLLSGASATGDALPRLRRESDSGYLPSAEAELPVEP